MDYVIISYKRDGKSKQMVFTEEDTPDFFTFAPMIVNLVKTIKGTEDKEQKHILLEELWSELLTNSLLRDLNIATKDLDGET